MDLQFFGANCFRLTTKQAGITIDDNLSELGVKSPYKKGDIVLYTSAHGIPSEDSALIVDQPGEFELSNISLVGIAARAHMDEEGQFNATMFKMVIEDVKFLITGHIYPELTEQQLEQIGLIDVMIVPIGGNGYTLDSIGALKVIKKVEPKLVIPSHYASKKLTYPVPQSDLESAVKGLGMEIHETMEKMKLKHSDLPESTRLVVLEESAK